MQYQAQLSDKGVTLFWNGNAVLTEVTLEVSLTRHEHFVALPTEMKTENGQTTILFDGHEKMERLALILQEEKDVLALSLDAEIRNFYHLYCTETFVPDDAVKLHFKAANPPEKIVTRSIMDPWWQTPAFPATLEEMPPLTQTALVKTAFGAHMHIQPLIAFDFRTDLSGNTLLVSAGVGGRKALKGQIASLSLANDPYEAVSETFVCQKKMGNIRVPLRGERPYPEIFESFGWCTWNAFYHDVTSAKIFEKLDEFRQMGVQIGWVLIDDGWSQYTEGQKLSSFKEDRTKFPEGLKETVRRMKEEYGIKHVGVWHTFTGYWMGIAPDSELYNEQKENIMETNAGWLLPAVHGEAAFRFWDAWHSYLAEQGIDFVKVDNQSSLSAKLDGYMSTAEGVRLTHAALERSVNKNFGGAIINCMGMNNENIQNRPTSSLNRNSDDFFPKLEGGFKDHIYENAYNAIAHSCLQHCDYDMWWSKHETALESSVLRAISGGPIYISDELNGTDTTYIKPLVREDGTILRPDNAARPTYDCLYEDCAVKGIPLKLFNSSGDKLAVAAFGMSDTTAKSCLRLADIPGAKGSYVAVDYFTGKEVVMNEETVIPLALDKGQVALFNLYPVKNGKATIGDTKYYMGCVAPAVKEITV